MRDFPLRETIEKLGVNVAVFQYRHKNNANEIRLLKEHWLDFRYEE